MPALSGIRTSGAGDVIPKIIHQIFLSGAPPAVLGSNVERLKDMNPGWEHRLYDCASALDAVRGFYGDDMARIVEKINPAYGAARADLLRHLLIHAWGGVYLDIKSTFVQPIDRVLREDDGYLLCQWHNGPGESEAGFGLHPDLRHIPGGEYQTFHVIAEPGHAFSKAAIERISRNVVRYKPWNSVGRMGVLRTTGPIAYTLAVHPIVRHHPHRCASAEELGLKWSLAGGYAHSDVFTTHYSQLSSPVVTLGPIGTTLSGLFTGARARARALRGRKAATP